MNIFRRLAMATKQTFEAVWSTKDPAWYARNGFTRIYEMLGGGSGTATGITMNVPLAMECGAAYVCTRAITESLASMPLHLMQRKSESTRKAKESPLYGVLARRPNSYQTAKVFWRTLTHHALNYGNGYARVVRRGNKADEEVIALHIIHPRNVAKKVKSGGDVEYTVTNEDGWQQKFGGNDIFHVMAHSDDGITGVGAVQQGRGPIALSMAIDQYASAFFARGGVPAGMVVKELPFTSDEARKRFREDWAKEYEGFQGFFKKMLVEGGNWKFERFGLSPTDSQLTDAQGSMISAVARFYGITPHLAGDLSRATFSNIEHLWIEFLQITLMPWMVAIEQEIERVLLTPAQAEDGYFAKFNANVFQRGDFETRMKGYSMMLQNGKNSINEIRRLEDEDEIPGGDAHHIQLNMQTVPGSGEPTASERATLVKISEGKPKEASK